MFFFRKRKASDDRSVIRGNIVILLEDENSNVICIKQSNIITSAGDIYYAQKAAGEAPTNNFSIFEFGIGGTAPNKASNRSAINPVPGSQMPFVMGYPRTNDTEPLNTGKGVNVNTFRGFYNHGVAQGIGIDRVIITIPSPGGTAPLLMYGVLSQPFNKGPIGTLTIFVNHTFSGV